MIKRFYVVCFKGKIQEVVTTAEEASKVFKETPVFEIFPKFHDEGGTYKTIISKSAHIDDEYGFIKEFVSSWYECMKQGPYGDVIQVTRQDIYDSCAMYTIDYLAHRAFIKPGLAGDIVPFVCDSRKNVYLIGIIRGGNKGHGKFAVAGGFNDIKKYKKETAAENASREGREEIGLEIICAPEYQNVFSHRPYAAEIPVIARFGGLEIATVLKYVRTFETEGEEIPDLELLRVSETSAYTLCLPVDGVLTADDAAALFVAGDDASKIVAVPLSEIQDQDFAFPHHRDICREAQEMLGIK